MGDGGPETTIWRNDLARDLMAAQYGVDDGRQKLMMWELLSDDWRAMYRRMADTAIAYLRDQRSGVEHGH